MLELGFDEIKDLLHSRNFSKTIDAIKILGSKTDKESNQLLINFLVEQTNDKFYETDKYSVIESAIQSLPHNRTVDSLIIRLNASTRSIEIRNILRILGIIGSMVNRRNKKHKEIGKCLLEPFLRNYDYKTKRIAATYLGKMKFKQAIPIIIDEIENRHVSHLGKIKLLNTLVIINSYNELFREFQNKKEDTKLFILDVLEKTGKPNKDITNFLEKIISVETTISIRIRSIKLIGELKLGELASLLTDIAEYDPNVDIRLIAITTFNTLLEQRIDSWIEDIALFFYIHMLENDYASKIRNQCALMLGKFDNEDEILTRALITAFQEDSSRKVRETAEISLQSISEKLGYNNITELIVYYNKKHLDKPDTKQNVIPCFKFNEPVCPKNLEENPNFVFIAMPFRDNFERVYNEIIKPTLLENGFYPKKVNEEPMTGDIMCRICSFIQQSKYAIINISKWNANVTFELGLVWGLGKKALLLKDEDCKEVPADLRSMLYVPYSYDKLDKLKKDLDGFIKREFKK